MEWFKKWLHGEIGVVSKPALDYLNDHFKNSIDSLNANQKSFIEHYQSQMNDMRKSYEQMCSVIAAMDGSGSEDQLKRIADTIERVYPPPKQEPACGAV